MPFVQGTDETHARVTNPLAENEAHLRTSLLETLSRRAEFNLAHRSGDIRLFEIGSAFLPRANAQPREELRLGVVLMGRRRPAHFTDPNPPAFDEWDAKGIVESVASIIAPGQTFELTPDGKNTLWQVRVGDLVIGGIRRLQLDAPVWASPAYGIEITLGEIATTPPAARGEHDYQRSLAKAAATRVRYAPLPTMPAAEFDLALLVPVATTAADVERVIRAAAGELLERLELFDLYTGSAVPAGQRSIAWRLTFRHADRTLRDKEIEGRRNKILGALQQELNVRQRTG